MRRNRAFYVYFYFYKITLFGICSVMCNVRCKAIGSPPFFMACMKTTGADVAQLVKFKSANYKIRNKN